MAESSGSTASPTQEGPTETEPPYSMVIRGGSVVTEDAVVRADVAIRQGRIAAVEDPGTGRTAGWEAPEVIDATGLYLMPGAVDPHTHWGSMGDLAAQCRADSEAAALGGTTTAGVLHRMEPDGFGEAVSVASRTSSIDFILTPTITSQEHADRIETTLDVESPSIKFFLSYRNVPGAEPGDAWNELTPDMFEQSLRRMGLRDGTLACVHAEDSEVIAASTSGVARGPQDGLAEWEAANPPAAEVAAIRFAAGVGRDADVSIYFVHLSGRDSLAELRAAKSANERVYGETCPHYLFHDVTTSSIAKFSPPVRHVDDREALWEALATGVIDTVGSDNSTTTLEEKSGSVWSMRRGGPEAGFLLPVVLSEGVNKRGLDLVRAAHVTSTNAAKIFGLYPRKGSIAVGSDADIAVVDLGRTVQAGVEVLGGAPEYTLYDGVEMSGWPVMTILRGRVICRDSEIVDAGEGVFLDRTGHSAPGG